MEINKKFKVCDLFPDVKWNTLSRGDKLRFGKLFANAVKDKKIKGVRRIGKAENNSALYEKIEESEYGGKYGYVY